MGRLKPKASVRRIIVEVEGREVVVGGEVMYVLRPWRVEVLPVGLPERIAPVKQDGQDIFARGFWVIGGEEG